MDKKANIKFLGMQPGDVKKTYADISYSKKMINYNPKTNIDIGIGRFLNWFKDYNNL